MSTELNNSRRQFEKSTYTPLKTGRQLNGQGADALVRASMVRGLEITPAELDQLRARIGDQSGRAALDAITKLTQAVSGPATLDASAALARVPGEDLLAIGKTLQTLRSEISGHLADSVRSLDQRYTESQKADGAAGQAANNLPGTAGASKQTPALANPSTNILTPSPAGTGGKSANPGAVQPSVKLISTAPTTVSLRAAQIGMASQVDAQPVIATAVGINVTSRLSELSTWAAQAEPATVNNLIDSVRGFVPARRAATLTSLPSTLADIAQRQLAAELFLDAVASLTRQPLEPIGLLHLERLEMTPLEIERGELLYSLPLAPEEKVTLAHREWSIREEEFSDFIEDYLENFSEKGVAETQDIASSTGTQTRHSNALSLSQSPAASGGATMTAPVDTTANPAQSSVEDETSNRRAPNIRAPSPRKRRLGRSRTTRYPLP